MMDAFSVMGMDRRLDLDLEHLRGEHDRRSREVHPDAGGDEAEFARVRESYEILRDPVRRVRHWLELHGSKPEVAMNMQASAEMFGEVGALIARCDEVLRKKAEGRSALVKSLAEREGMALLSEIEEALAAITNTRESLQERFADFDAREAETCVEEVASVAGTMVFLDKWESQLRERWVRLGM